MQRVSVFVLFRIKGSAESVINTLVCAGIMNQLSHAAISVWCIVNFVGNITLLPYEPLIPILISMGL